ncbi:spliceosome-associated protein CWC27 homolog [Planococcus citri]|uniref:spliceosome-associated protein CWC27 homolog n=1 Tax=Planococcus citri TaxID=170843 RepID=UPI0031F7584A
MSNIYIQEPSTTGKVLLKTTFGDIDIELWSREAPKACRNFVQLCMEGFYDGNIFHRVVKGFIAQTGDPTGTGTCNESIYGTPFKDEIHSRLRFVRRGLVACANAGKDDNGSQFFFTFAATPELQGKHTIFGKVAGDTVYNLLHLEKAMVDEGDRPVYEQKIIKTKILNNPFDDIVPRVTKKEKEKSEKTDSKKKKEERGVKNFKLLSFGDEAEEDELETTIENKKFEGKSKSTHDVLNDPKLSSKTLSDEEKGKDSNDTDDDDEKEKTTETQLRLEDIKNKLKGAKKKDTPKPKEESSDEDELWSSVKKEKKRKLEEIRSEIKSLQRENRREKKQKVEKEETEKKEKLEKSEILDSYEKEKEKYTQLSKTVKLKGKSREDLTAELLKKFNQKLATVENEECENPSESKEAEGSEPADDWTDLLNHRLECDSNDVLAKDANTKADDWYEIYDPRNPINKRRRELSKKQLSEKGRAKDHL